ncbi:uncharacterized protein [Spinacia oleracea]|uniref:Uncharacterized protein isoform X2 n=1 Tax=Spinacia oleracea TaxID=3562 RepID=A0ABM3RG84_SPIOL|nr:uncharacterized protein LOC110801182 isoform X2 [Spinacia oleracea]
MPLCKHHRLSIINKVQLRVAVLVSSAWVQVEIYFSATQVFLVFCAHAMVCTCQYLNFASIQGYLMLIPDMLYAWIVGRALLNGVRCTSKISGAPGDHRGWDWPERLLATSGLTNSSMAVADRRKVFDMSSLFNSSAESSLQPQNNVSTSRPRSTQEFSNQILKNAQMENGCNHCNMGTSRRNSHNMTDDPKIASPTLRNSKPSLPSDKEGSGNGCHCENSFSSAFQNLQSVGSRENNSSKDKVVLQRGPFSSSIDLKLGQPSQLSRGTGPIALTTVRHHTSGVQAATVQEKLNQNSNSKVSEKNTQHLFCKFAADFSRTKELFLAGPLNNAPTSFLASPLNNALISTNSIVHAEHLKDGLYSSSTMSVPVRSSNNTAGGNLYNKEINKRKTDNHSFSPRTLHYQPCLDRSVLIDFSCNGDAPIRPSDINKSALPNNMGRIRDATCGREGSIVGSESGSRLYAKEMESSGFTGNGKSCNPNGCALTSAKFTIPETGNIPSGVSGASNYVGNTCNLASNPDRDQFSNKLKNSSFNFRTTPTLQATSSGFTPLSTFLAPGYGSVSFSKDVEAVNSRIRDESLKLLSLRNVEKSFKEKPMDASLVLDQPSRIHADKRQQSENCKIPDLRAHALFFDHGSFEEQRHGRPFSVGHIVSPSFLPDVGHKKGENLGAVTEETTLLSKLADNYNEDPCNRQPKQQSSLSVERQENMECGCNMVKRCNGGSCHISAKCSYNVQTVCSKRNQENIAVVETPRYSSSRISEDRVFIEKTTGVECNQKEKELKFKSDCGNSQWIDVPSKAYTVSKMICQDAPTHLLDTREESETNLKELAAKGIFKSDQAAELLKVKELSNISSGCSAPVVTQESNEVNMIDSGTVGGCHTMYGNGQIADQGSSAISRSSSSVEAIDSVRSSILVCDGKTKSTEDTSLTVSENVAHHEGINEFRQTYSNELQNFTVSGGSSDEVSNNTQNDDGFKRTKRKRTTKWKTLGASFTVSNQSNQISSKMHSVNSSYNSLKQGRSAMVAAKMLSRKRDLNRIYNSVEGGPSNQRLLEDNDHSIDIPENAIVKNLKQVKATEADKATKAVKVYSLDNSTSNRTLKNSAKGCQQAKPVACGKYGIICDQELDFDQLRPPKIVPLSQVLKASERHAKFEKEPVLPSIRKKKNVRCNGGRKLPDLPFSSHRSQGSQFNKFSSCHSREGASILETQQMHLDNTQSDDPDASEEGGADGGERNLSVSTSRPAAISKTKEIRMRSLYELSMRGNKFISSDISRSQNIMSASSTVCELEMNTQENAGRSEGGEHRASGKRSCRKLHCSSLLTKMDKLCCVCGISNKDNANCLLECGHCLIQIHQACYGISRVPKTDWYCRPCRTSSKDVACVLCGYKAGAMTRAFGSRNVVKSLLKAWDIRTEPHIMNLGSAEALYVPAKMECRNNSESATYQPCPSIKPVVHNSIISGLFDPTVKQWVHMVCGLWTPGTRCPNVDTMSAFDVSGVSLLKDYMVCYICKRPGGSCIRCCVETCHTHFHPWCAHQKGLLQSEVEGVDRDQIGFYGRCFIHADSRACHVENDNDTNKADSETEREGEPTCARTEGYKGKKQGDVQYSSYQRNGKDGCLVTQVQLDAWLYINRHKLSKNKQPKPPISDVDHDYRKEYARYKQARDWKHLLVYKSGIHALGLYTSQFFQRGAMVVEYVGEIVGHRVADKRESEYLSGKKLQYKSACYFFRIDKEQIIDATCKGGIARFVNHSCQPNCVAKVLTIRGEKKVVFLAQRDIYPGEEITYDYHFNREDEGKKIPCFCNSKNCRRYLN